FFLFFFQAEDGIRDFHVTGVQTCALPISAKSVSRRNEARFRASPGTIQSKAAGRIFRAGGNSTSRPLAEFPSSASAESTPNTEPRKHRSNFDAAHTPSRPIHQPRRAAGDADVGRRGTLFSTAHHHTRREQRRSRRAPEHCIQTGVWGYPAACINGSHFVGGAAFLRPRQPRSTAIRSDSAPRPKC